MQEETKLVAFRGRSVQMLKSLVYIIFLFSLTLPVMNIRLLFLVLNVDPSKKNPSVQILLSILNQPFNKKGKSIIFFHIKAATRRYSRLDINVTHHLACDRLLLQQNVSCIPDDYTQLISIGTKHREKIQ